ncbi:pilin [Endozoicomonas acroporae]|uniref:pilin n=1 Tax=Endozoicomonas acroporae TaxID=1701104 RepID=UPI003D797644
MKKQQGFTLIELMIVVAIIGILAAVAIPQYQNYVERTKISKAFSMVSPVLTSLALEKQTEGAYPVGNDQGEILNDLGIPAPTTGDYLSAIDITTATGVVTITFANTNSNTLDAKKLAFTPTAAGDKWNCAAPSASPVTNTTALALCTEF